MNRDTMRLNQKLPDITPIQDGLIMCLFKQGCDTVAIARHMRLTEHQVANRLLHIREAGR